MTWSLKQKVLAGYGLLLALTVANVIWSIAIVHHLGTATDAILRENYRSIFAMNEMMRALDRQDRAALLLLLGRSSQAQAEFDRGTATFYEWYGREQDNITVPGEGAVAVRLGTDYRRFQTGFDRLRAAMREGPSTARAYYRGSLRKLRDRVASDIDSLRSLNQNAMYAASAHAEHIASGAVFSLALAGLILLILGSTFSLVLARIVVRPILRLIEATANLAEGGYGLEIEPRSRDELGTLIRSFNSMAQRIKTDSDNRVAEVLAAERKSEAIVQSLEDGVLVVDTELRVVLINRAAREFLGSTPKDQERPHLLELLDDSALCERVRETMKRSGAPIVSESEDVLELSRDRTSHYYQIGINPILGAGSAASGVVLLLRDVTRLKEVERMKSEFVMTASHELKTPLTSIGMSIALLGEHLGPTLTEKDRELLAAASEETARLTSLVNDLLDLSRIEAGRIEMDFQDVPPALVLGKACDVLHAQAKEKGVALEWKVVGSPGRVHADVTKATWVITNLIANALRHTASGGWIRCTAEQQGEWIHFAVADNGAGIAPEDQSRIFDRFAQVKGEQGGTGLGLAICREIVRASGGTIWVESEPGKGSTFFFTLAAVEPTSQEDAS